MPPWCRYWRFYSSPSCDGDRGLMYKGEFKYVSILPRLATGIDCILHLLSLRPFLFFPVLRRGSHVITSHQFFISFYSSPSCDGDPSLPHYPLTFLRFYSSPSCDGDRRTSSNSCMTICFYSSPSCDGDHMSMMTGVDL